MYLAAHAEPTSAPILPSSQSIFDLEALARELGCVRRQVAERKHLFRAGQPMQALYLVHAGCLKTTVVSPDGREQITGFRMRGELLGLDALGTSTYACDAVALDLSEVWQLPVAQLDACAGQLPQLREFVTTSLAREIRRDWQWMLTLGTLNAEQRVACFLLELADRQKAMGYSARQLMLRMTRADLGNFLSLQLETVTRILTRLANLGMIEVERRQIVLSRPEALRGMLTQAGEIPRAIAA
jgi:CRP/FNR family transcriptional regulator